MTDYPKFETANMEGKKVVVRADLDVDIQNDSILDTTRLEGALLTLSATLDKGAKSVLLIGHRGRPENGFDEDLSLAPLVEFFKSRLTEDLGFVGYRPTSQYFEAQEEVLKSPSRVTLLENLRFWKEEEGNDTDFAQNLAYGQELYVNDAFASSHRAHASIVGVPKVISGYIGSQFEKEIQNLSKVFENPKKPVVSIISGVKKDKLDYLEGFKKFSDTVLVGGRLPEYMGEGDEDPKLLVGRLNPDKEDLTIHSIEKFEEQIATAGTIIFAGPPGLYEDPGHKLATERVIAAIANNIGALRIAGGGDTGAAIHHFHAENSFDWISSGGGATLEFLANGTLPGLSALVN